MEFDTRGLLLAAFLLLVVLVTVYRVTADRRRREGLVAMAARRGWTLQMQDRLTASGITHLTGRENGIRVTPRDGGGWRCEVTNWDEERENPDRDSSAELVTRKGWTDFFDPAWRAPDGLNVTVGPPDPSRATARLRQIERGGDAPSPVNRGAGLPDGISVLAPDGVPEGIDLPRIAAAAVAWRARHPDAAPLVLAWWDGGLRVRMEEDAIDAGRLEDFLLAALEMRAAIRPAA